MPHYPQHEQSGEPLATALGWFSIGLGLAEVTMPGSLARLIGVRPDRGATTALRALGAREMRTASPFSAIRGAPRASGRAWAATSSTWRSSAPP